MLGTELPSHDLAADRQRQLRDEFHDARILVRSQTELHEFLDFARELGRRDGACPEHDDGFDELRPHRIRNADDGGDCDRRMLEKTLFDFDGSDAVPGARDQIVGSSLEPRGSRPRPRGRGLQSARSRPRTSRSSRRRRASIPKT